jgi:hypothetical protein
MIKKGRTRVRPSDVGGGVDVRNKSRQTWGPRGHRNRSYGYPRLLPPALSVLGAVENYSPVGSLEPAPGSPAENRAASELTVDVEHEATPTEAKHARRVVLNAQPALLRNCLLRDCGYQTATVSFSSGKTDSVCPKLLAHVDILYTFGARRLERFVKSKIIYMARFLLNAISQPSG